MKDDCELVCDLSNGAIYNDREWRPNIDFKITILFNVQ